MEVSPVNRTQRRGSAERFRAGIPSLVKSNEQAQLVPVEMPTDGTPLSGLDELAQDVLRTADLPYLRDESICELLRRHILRRFNAVAARDVRKARRHGRGAAVLRRQHVRQVEHQELVRPVGAVGVAVVEDFRPVREPQGAQQGASELFMFGLFLGELIADIVQVSHHEHVAALLIRPAEQGPPQLGGFHPHPVAVAQPVLVHADRRRRVIIMRSFACRRPDTAGDPSVCDAESQRGADRGARPWVPTGNPWIQSRETPRGPQTPRKTGR